VVDGEASPVDASSLQLKGFVEKISFDPGVSDAGVRSKYRKDEERL